MGVQLTANAEVVLRRRYLHRDPRGNLVETPDQLLDRVARAVAAADARYGADPSEVAATARTFLERMRSLEFLPNSPTLMNAGRELGQLAACFVVPIPDETPAIFEAVKSAAIIQKTGGGTGFAFSSLRPSGDFVASTGGIASGPVSFMQVFDVATEAVKQGGTRRGANMGILRVDHPDILDFIALKLDPAKMRNFNLSVAVTDAFMSAVRSGDDYDLVNPRSGEVVRRLSARRVWDLIANAAWTIGDPGLVFIDRINAAHPVRHLGEIAATNPCGEQPLLPYESCTLGSINLSRFGPKRGLSPFGPKRGLSPSGPKRGLSPSGPKRGLSPSGPGRGDGGIDRDGLARAIHDAVHFLDNVIDVNSYPLPEIEAATRATRKIGLGVMGLADLLIDLGIPYDSDDALAVAEDIAILLDRESVAASRELATRRGTFPAFLGSTWDRQGMEMRNATTTTVAPTGTISIIAGCSSGIEPLYAIAYERNVLDGERLREIHEGFARTMKERGAWTDAVADAVTERGRVRGLASVPDDVQQLFPTAHDIPPEQHVRMQAAFQRHVHAAVSKTINMPQSSTPADIEAAYALAYDSGCKGVTVYRDRSREAQVLVYGDDPPGTTGIEREAEVGEVAEALAAERERALQFGADSVCPECSSPVVMHSRCRVCRACGWSACSL